MAAAELSARRGCAAAALREAGLDALLLCPGADQYYLTGFEHGHALRRLLAFVLRADGSGHWIAPEMNAPQLEPHLAGDGLRLWGDGEGYLAPLREALEGVRSLAFDEETRAAFLLDLQQVRPDCRVRPSSTVMRALRLRKSAEELALLRRAGRTVDETIPEALALCRPGRTEAEVDQGLRAALARRSPESEVAFTIVASGPNGALPHHDTGRRPLQEGDVVILDFGTRYHGYHSDITVTCSVGEPPDPDADRVYRVVFEAQQRALEAIRPGVPVGEVDRAARSTIEAAGYGAYFVHRTGHGLGLQLHEPPFVVPGGEEPLEEGMVFSVEPGVYLPGRFGVRLEIITAVGASGAEPINASRPPELPRVR